MLFFGGLVNNSFPLFLFDGIVMLVCFVWVSTVIVRYRRKTIELEGEKKKAKDEYALLLQKLIIGQIETYVDIRRSSGCDISISEPAISRVINSQTKRVEEYVFVSIFSAEKSLSMLVREIYVSIYPYEKKLSLFIDGDVILQEAPMEDSLKEFFDCIKNRVATMGSVSVKASI